MGITHAFVSSKDQGTDETKVSKDEWNADHAGDFVAPAADAGTVVIPGLTGSPDVMPASPSSYDDEFDTTDSSDPITGWTTLGSFTALTSNVVPSHLRMYTSSSTSYNVNGIYKAIPSMPFTVTAKLTDYLHNANYQHIGIMLTEASPGKLFLYGPCSHTGHSFWTTFMYFVWNSRTSRSSTYSEPDGPYRKPYIRLIVASSTDVTTQCSEDGLVWVTKSANVNPGFTIGNVGLFTTANEIGSIPIEVVVDWIRFT